MQHISLQIHIYASQTPFKGFDTHLFKQTFLKH